MKRYVVETTLYHKQDDEFKLIDRFESPLARGSDYKDAEKHMVSAGQISVRTIVNRGWKPEYVWPADKGRQRIILFKDKDTCLVVGKVVITIQEYANWVHEVEHRE